MAEVDAEKADAWTLLITVIGLCLLAAFIGFIIGFSTHNYIAGLLSG